MEMVATAGDYINVFSSIILMPCMFLSLLLWVFHDIGLAMKNNDNWCMKVYKGLRKAHIPLGAAGTILGTYHTIFATIKHGWSGITWGNITFLLFALGFVVFLLRKPMGRIWLPAHRILTAGATVTMLIHCVPFIKFVFTFILPWLLTGEFPT